MPYTPANSQFGRMQKPVDYRDLKSTGVDAKSLAPTHRSKAGWFDWLFSSKKSAPKPSVSNEAAQPSGGISKPEPLPLPEKTTSTPRE
jgi:hypothetical protein